MKQTDTGHYDVLPDEQVTLTVEAHKVAEDLAVSLDGNTLTRDSSNPATYSFAINPAAVAQFIDISCHFSAVDPGDAFFRFFVRGSFGGGQFNASSIRKMDADWESVLQFTLP